MLSDWGMPASQYRGFFGAIRLKLALAHDMPSPPPSVFQSLFLREMALGPLNTGKGRPGSSKAKRNYNCGPHMPTIVVCSSERWRHFNAEPLLIQKKSPYVTLEMIAIRGKGGSRWKIR